MRHNGSSTGIVILLAGLGGGVLGCASPSADRQRPDPRPLGEDRPAYQAPKEGSTETNAVPAAVNAAGPLTLQKAVSLALKHNPELASYSWEIRSREAWAFQAGLWPNPELEAGAEGLGKSGADRGFGEASVGISQLFLTAGKLSKRTEVAALRSDLAAWDYETKRLEVITQVAKTYVKVLAAQRQVELARASAELAQRVYHTVSQQAEEGEVSPVEQTRTGVVLSLARVEWDRAERDLQAARDRLAATWGDPTADYDQATGELGKIARVPSLEQLAKVISENPTIARWAVEMTSRRAELRLAEAQAYPDVKVKGAVQQFGEGDETAAIAAVSVPLPLFDRNQGGIRAARSELGQAQSQRRAAEVRVRSSLNTSYYRLQAAYKEATTLREKTLPDAEQAFESVEAGYQAGKFGLLDVLDAERTLFDIRRQYVEAMARYHQGRAEVEGLIARPLEQIFNSSNIDTKPQGE